MNGVSIFTVDQAKFTNLALVGTACIVCSKIPDELLRCQQCRRISYCSDACKNADVEAHEKICLALQLAPQSTPPYLRQMIFQYGASPYDLEPDVALLNGAMREAFDKMLAPEKVTRAQSDLLLYEPRCAVCLRSADDVRSTLDPEYTTLLFCPHCRAAFSCTEAHAAEYLDEHCKELEEGECFTECELNQRAYEDSLEIVTRGWTLKETLWFPMRRKSEYTPLPTATDTLTAWDQWFADPTNICPPDSSPILNRIRTKQLSIPMTVLYGMELFDKAAGKSPELKLPLLSSRTELDIAVIGVKEYELRFGGLACWEEILHSLPSLRRLTVRFIGPELIYGILSLSSGLNLEALKWEPCALCKEKGVEFHHSYHPAKFHDYVANPEKYTHATGGDDEDEPAASTPTPFQWPDLAIVFNSGMGINPKTTIPQWTPTLELLAKNSVPTLCTAFLYRESEEDESLLNSTRCNIVIGRHKNPWRSEVLTKQVFTRKYFFSYNNFVQGFRGMVERDESEENSDSTSEPPFDEEKFFDLLAKLLPTMTL